MNQSHRDESLGTTRDTIQLIEGVQVTRRAVTKDAETVLTQGALRYIRDLYRELRKTRHDLLQARKARQEQYDAGGIPAYLFPDSWAVKGDWKVAPLPADLRRRRVEITGPASSPKMVINMLSPNQSGVRADAAMLDFEDSMKPEFSNVIQAFHNVIGAVEGDLHYTDPTTNKHYSLPSGDLPLIMVRPRGLHLTESNVLIDGEAISAGLFDLALCFYHTGRTLLESGRTPKYYIPKCEHFLEARWWNNLFILMQEKLSLPLSSLRATFLIETLPAAYQIEEILHEVKEHAAGMNGGRWDKIFSDIKTLKLHPSRVMADRATIDMRKPWMDSYVRRMIRICHRRGALALGGMSAFTPGSSEAIRAAQTEKVLQDKKHEASIGHDGCWVSHPYFIDKALSAFTNDNQLTYLGDASHDYPDLMPRGEEPRTIEGLRTNIRVGIAYMHGWQEGHGCIAWDNLMEDLATLEISRVQVWQWLHHGISLDDGTKVTRALVEDLFDQEHQRIVQELKSDNDGWQFARDAAEQVFLAPTFRDFFEDASPIA